MPALPEPPPGAGHDTHWGLDHTPPRGVLDDSPPGGDDRGVPSVVVWRCPGRLPEGGPCNWRLNAFRSKPTPEDWPQLARHAVPHWVEHHDPTTLPVELQRAHLMANSVEPDVIRVCAVLIPNGGPTLALADVLGVRTPDGRMHDPAAVEYVAREGAVIAPAERTSMVAAVAADLDAMAVKPGGVHASLRALARYLAEAIDAHGATSNPATTARLAQELRTVLSDLARRDRESGDDAADWAAGLAEPSTEGTPE